MPVLHTLPQAVLAAAIAALPSLALAAPLQLKAPAQEGAPEMGVGDPRVARGEAWAPRTNREAQLLATFGDHCLAVVGDKIVTFMDIRQFINGRDYDDPANRLPADLTREEVIEERLQAGLQQSVTEELKILGGQNQGYELELIQRAVEETFQRQVESRGGAVNFSNWLSGTGFDADSFRDFLEGRLLAQFWSDAVSGAAAGAAGRPFVDAYVRPGSLHRRYQNLSRSPIPAMGEEIGRRPATISLRRLVIDSQTQGSVERATALAEAAREYLLSGSASFDSVVEEYAPEDLRGEASRLEFDDARLAEQLAAYHPGPAAAEFFASAAPGDLSPVFRFDAGQGRAFLFLYRLEGRQEAQEALPFVDLGLQRDLLEAMTTERSRIRIERGLSDLALTTHIVPLNLRQAIAVGGSGR